MKRQNQIIASVAMLLGYLLSQTSLAALEPGQGPQTKAGIAIGVSAAPAPAGLYMVTHTFFYGLELTGPGVTPPNPRGHVAEMDPGFLWVPGWNVLGAVYSAYIAFPFVGEHVDRTPAFQGTSFTGVHNSFISPLRLQWSLDNGFFVQSGFGVYVPDGTITGPLGNSNTGADYLTFQPHFVFSYVKDGWNLTAYTYAEINTENQRSDYTTGTIFHADFTATKTFGNWTVGPVAYYVAQVSSDKPGLRTDAALTAAIPVPGGIHGFDAGKFEAFALGGLVGYNFGPFALTIWGTNEVFSRAYGGYSGTPFLSTIPFTSETTTNGWTVFARLTSRLWGPQ
jgi:hypothetical protein